MQDVRIPTYYVLNRATAHESLDEVTQALWFTPCVAAVISCYADESLAGSLAPTVLFSGDPTTLARELAAKTSRPVLVIGHTKTDVLLEAVYEDGSRQEVSIYRRPDEEKQAQDS